MMINKKEIKTAWLQIRFNQIKLKKLHNIAFSKNITTSKMIRDLINEQFNI